MPVPEVRSEPLLPCESRSVKDRTMTLRERVGSFVHISREVFEKEKKDVCWHGIKWGCCVGIGVLLGLMSAGWWAVPDAQSWMCGDKQKNVDTVRHYSLKSQGLVAVNLGGWLCLEDWFHSGSVGRCVSTPNSHSQGQGACLPPMLTSVDEPWPSEGILVNRLVKMRNTEYASEVFTAFRKHFVNENDFKEIASLGIKTVRIPFTWAMFADALAEIDKDSYGMHDPLMDAVVVPDPYHPNVSMVTIPRTWFRQMLEMGAKHKLRFILDLHNMVGGSADGTYSGVWPLEPAFWNKNATVGNGHIPLLTMGTMISNALVKFIEEDLKDLVSNGHIWGVCFMNEPAHLSGLPGQKWGAFATPKQVLHYVDVYANIFRASTLPQQGVRLYIQLIETAWPNATAFDTEVTNWYHTMFSSQERYAWAVIARHFYTAWGCNGGIMKIPNAMYQCDQAIDVIKAGMNTCITKFSQDFASKFQGLRAVTEWSLGTYFDANLACSNSDVLRALYAENMDAFSNIEPENQIEPVFWSWKMPYGPKFQAGWSLKSFSGMDELADSNGVCMVGDWAKESYACT